MHKKHDASTFSYTMTREILAEFDISEVVRDSFGYLIPEISSNVTLEKLCFTGLSCDSATTYFSAYCQMHEYARGNGGWKEVAIDYTTDFVLPVEVLCTRDGDLKEFEITVSRSYTADMALSYGGTD